MGEAHDSGHSRFGVPLRALQEKSGRQVVMGSGAQRQVLGWRWGLQEDFQGDPRSLVPMYGSNHTTDRSQPSRACVPPSHPTTGKHRAGLRKRTPTRLGESCSFQAMDGKWKLGRGKPPEGL